MTQPFYFFVYSYKIFHKTSTLALPLIIENYNTDIHQQLSNQTPHDTMEYYRAKHRNGWLIQNMSSIHNHYGWWKPWLLWPIFCISQATLYKLIYVTFIKTIDTFVVMEIRSTPAWRCGGIAWTKVEGRTGRVMRTHFFKIHSI